MAGPRITFKIKRPRSMNILIYSTTVNKAMLEELEITERSFKRISKNFTAPLPKYFKDIRREGEDMVGEVKTDDKRMFFLNEGTGTRWAVMSKNFTPKTKVRTIGSGRGSGKAVIAGRQAMVARGIAPRPGVQAREFTDEIAKRRQDPYTTKMQKAMNKAANNTF